MTRYAVVELRVVKSRKLIDALWSIYEALGDLEVHSPFAQGLCRIQFDAAMVDHDALKLIIFDQSDKQTPIALVLISSKPDEVHWLSKRYFARYKQDGRAMWYIVGATSKRVRIGGLLLNRLVDYLCGTLPQDGIIFFDYSSTSHESMMRFAERMGKRNGMVVKVIDQMVFCSAERVVSIAQSG